MLALVDSHAHIDGSEYDIDRAEVVARARAAGVGLILNIGTGDPHSGNLERAVALTTIYECVYAAVGTHPHDASLYDEAAEERIRGLVQGNQKVLAWGEIGLDYHYDHSPREVQRAVFARQLRAARELCVPVIIHARAADEDVIELLRREYGMRARAGIMHCFGGNLELARAALDLGFMISFAGNVTFKNAGNLREIARQIPLSRLLAETDCPYLTPVPYRGRRNEPARVVETTACLAELHGLSVEACARLLTANFLKFFRLNFPEADTDKVQTT